MEGKTVRVYVRLGTLAWGRRDEDAGGRYAVGRVSMGRGRAVTPLVAFYVASP